jgi:hypothetical protein
MAQKKNVFRRIAVPGLLGSLLLCQEHAHAQQDGQVQLEPNDQVIRAWQQNNLGGSGPSLKREEDGSTRLEWKGGLTVDTYSNDIYSAGGNLNTPLRTGAFYKNTFNSDLRATHKDNVVDYFQLGATTSNDLSVLSQNRYQINNLQLGRAGEGYMLSLGDVTPNFSSLSSALGVRGLYGQRQFDDVTVYGFTGMVAESWETLGNKVPRSQYLKDVHGVKLEKAFGTSLKTYVTSQSSSEREPTTVMAQPLATLRGKSRSFSGGFQYQAEQFTLSGETAGSRYEDDGSSDRPGRASIVDASWRGDGYGFRGGYHDISNGFTSLSLQAQPGVREAYAGVDWTVAPWIALATDVRRSRLTTLAFAGFDSTFVDSDSVAARANINFGADYPGWALAFQQAAARSLNSAAQASRNRDFSSTLNYSTPVWNAGVGFGRGKVTSEVSPASDSLNDNWAFNVGHTFSDAQGDLPQTWSVGVNLTAGAQTQRLLAGGQTSNTNYTFTLTGQRAGWGSVNLLVMSGRTTQLYGGPSLRLEGFQLEAVYAVNDKCSIKAYARNTRRNIDDPVLAAKESVAGLQLTVSF